MKKKLVIINNEKCTEKNQEFYCENIEISTLSEGLISKYNLKFLLRKKNIVPVYKINKSITKISPNLISFTKNLIKSIINDKSDYLIISVTPYTFFSFLLLLLFRKKIYLYLRSDGEKEISIIFGKFLSKVFKIIENFMANFSTLIVVNKHISKKKIFNLVNPSQIDDEWLSTVNSKYLNNDIKLLYIGRIKKEKGVFSLIKIFKKIVPMIEKNISLTVIGNGQIPKENHTKIKFFNAIYDKKKLISQYDAHSIFILPSYTEGHPQVLLESLARQRPVIVFREIKHVAEKFQGVFVCDRNQEDLLKVINYINDNYDEILSAMKKNIFPTKENFIKQLDKILT